MPRQLKLAAPILELTLSRGLPVSQCHWVKTGMRQQHHQQRLSREPHGQGRNDLGTFGDTNENDGKAGLIHHRSHGPQGILKAPIQRVMADKLGSAMFRFWPTLRIYVARMHDQSTRM
ncbi:MAG: hypothetical protein J0M20_10865 [Burkholderiales bacterium]|nr:hypothetical protein [Burkholderiales bacterium]